MKIEKEWDTEKVFHFTFDKFKCEANREEDGSILISIPDRSLTLHLGLVREALKTEDSNKIVGVNTSGELAKEVKLNFVGDYIQLECLKVLKEDIIKTIVQIKKEL